jgi:hypothetical protein
MWQSCGRRLATGAHWLGIWRIGASPIGGDDQLGASLIGG